MKRRYRVLLVLASSALAVAAMVAAGYKIENVRGANAWEQTRRELAAWGESLDPADFIPSPVPDDQNLALIPVFARALDYRVDPETKALTLGPKLPDDSPSRDMPYGHDGKKPKSLPSGGWEAGHPRYHWRQRSNSMRDGMTSRIPPGRGHRPTTCCWR